MDMHRTIQTFVRRNGRITPGQQASLDRLWSLYGIDYQPQLTNWDETFETTQPLVVEIGFGMGEALIAMAKDQPHNNFLGIDVYKPGLGKILAQIEALNLKNLKIMAHDAREVLENQIDSESISKVYVLFPDPWPKKKHHKRRLIAPDFLKLSAQKLKHQGTLHIATDWANYAEQIKEVLLASSEFKPTLEHYTTPHQYQRYPTKFESRGLRLGHQIWDFCAMKCS